MQEKNFISYEYSTKTVKAKDQTKAIDMYEAFGWEVTSTAPTLVDGVTLSLKRDRKLKHKQELTRLERQAENVFETINGLHRAKTMGASIFAYVFGSIAALVFGGGMCLTMLMEGSIPAFVGGIALGVAGIALCGVNYFIYKKLVDKKTKTLLSVIDENEEKLANILEKRRRYFESGFNLTNIEREKKDLKRKGRVENKFLKRMKNDYTFRTFVFSSLSCFVTVAFAGYNAILAISYRSAWNTGIAVYYTLLSCIRIYVIFSERKFYKTGLDEQRKGMQRKKRFLVQSILLFIIDFILIAPVAMMVMQQKEIHYTAIPAIAIAAYTTYKVTMSAKHFIKARKSNHLSIKMLRNINFVDALVSVLSLQYTLIMTFDGGSIKKDMHTLCAISSLIIWGWIIVISVFTLSRAIKLLQKNNVDI